MKRIAATILILVVSVVMLTGCAGSKLAGTWYEASEDMSQIVINKDGTFATENGSGTYETDGKNSVTFSYSGGYMSLFEPTWIMEMAEENGQTVLKYDNNTYYNGKENAEAAYAAIVEEQRQQLEAFAELYKKTIIGNWKYKDRSDDYKEGLTINEDLTYHLKSYNEWEEKYKTYDGQLNIEIFDDYMEISNGEQEERIGLSLLEEKTSTLNDYPDNLPNEVCDLMDEWDDTFERAH